MISTAWPSDWRKVAVGDLVTIAHGFAFKGEFFSPRGTDALATPGNFLESGGFRHVGEKQRYYSASFPASYRLQARDLIIAMTEQKEGLLGSAAFVPEKGGWLHNQRVGRVRRQSKHVSLKYLYHVFNSAEFRKSVAQTAAGTKVMHTSPTKLGVIDIPLPPKSAQERIAEALDDADKMILHLDRLVEKKLMLVQGTMQQLLTGHTRLPGFIKPWQRLKIEEILSPRSERNTHGLPLEVLTCTKHHGFVRSLEYFKNQVFSRDLFGYRIIYRGDIGYPANHLEEGSIGVQDILDKGLVSPIYVVARAKNGVDTYFLQRQLKLDSFRQAFARATNASVNRRGSLRWKAFSQITVQVPELGEQNAISSVLRDIEADVAVLGKRLEKTKAAKQGMMQELLSGRTRLAALEVTA